MDWLVTLERLRTYCFKKEPDFGMQEKIASIFGEVDKQDYQKKLIDDGDGYLNEVELEDFKTILKTKYQEIYQHLSDYFDSIKYNDDKNYRLANNFLALNDKEVLTKSLELLEKLNPEDFVNTLAHISSNTLFYGFFHNLRFYKDTPEQKAVYYEKLSGLAKKLLDYAKENDIYSKDYASRIEMAIEDRDLNLLGLCIDRLGDRIFLSTENENFPNVQARKLPLIEPDGKINSGFAQGLTGDCWFLSAINATAKTEQGLAKLNSMLSVQKDGDNILSVTVNIQGNEFVIDYEELKNANEYATGDLDVRAIEIAANRFLYETECEDISDGRFVDSGFELLFGEGNYESEEFGPDADGNWEGFDDYIQKLKTKSCISTIASNAYYHKKLDLEDEKGANVPLSAPHAYLALKADDKYLYIQDPHYSTKTLKVELEKVKECFDDATIIHLGENSKP